MHIPSPRRHRPPALSLVLTSALLATAAVTPAVATATPAGTIVGGSDAAAPTGQGTEVTLITGDVALVSVDEEGRSSAILRGEGE